MLDLITFLVIEIDIDPEIAEVGAFVLSWHGLFSAIGIIGGVWLAVRLAQKNGLPGDLGQEIAIISVIAAIIGARLFYVFEHWGDFDDNIAGIVTDINEGGITLYGGLIGGVIAGLAYGLYRRWPWGVTLDAAACGMILGQGIGRIGDLINGEHLATESNLPWAVRYVNENNDLAPDPHLAVHPTAGGYEMFGDFLILGILLWAGWGLGPLGRWLRIPERIREPFIRTPGWVFCLYLILYPAMRFYLSELRVDEQQMFDVPVPQVVSAVVIGIAVVAAGVLYRFPGPIPREYAFRMWGEGDEESLTPRAERRRST